MVLQTNKTIPALILQSQNPYQEKNTIMTVQCYNADGVGGKSQTLTMTSDGVINCSNLFKSYVPAPIISAGGSVRAEAVLTRMDGQLVSETGVPLSVDANGNYVNTIVDQGSAQTIYNKTLGYNCIVPSYCVNGVLNLSNIPSGYDAYQLGNVINPSVLPSSIVYNNQSTTFSSSVVCNGGLTANSMILNGYITANGINVLPTEIAYLSGLQTNIQGEFNALTSALYNCAPINNPTITGTLTCGTLKCTSETDTGPLVVNGAALFTSGLTVSSGTLTLPANSISTTAINGYVAGSTGPAGAAGATGPAGPAGPAGATGPAGASAPTNNPTFTGTLTCATLSCTSETDTGALTVSGLGTFNNGLTVSAGTVSFPAGSISATSITGGGSVAGSVSTANLTLPTTGFVAPTTGQLGYTAVGTYISQAAYAMSGGVWCGGSVSIGPGVWLFYGMMSFTTTANVSFVNLILSVNKTQYSIDTTHATNGILQMTVPTGYTSPVYANCTQVITNTTAGNTNYYLNWQVPNQIGGTGGTIATNAASFTATRIA